MVDIFFCGFMDCANGFLGGRVDGFEGLAILTFDELVVDEAVGQWSACGPERLVGVAKCHRIRIRCGVVGDDSARVILAHGGCGACSDMKKFRTALEDSQSSGLLIFACCWRF